MKKALSIVLALLMLLAQMGIVLSVSRSTAMEKE